MPEYGRKARCRGDEEAALTVNSTLKRLLADAELEKAAFEGDREGKLLSPERRQAAVRHLMNSDWEDDYKHRRPHSSLGDQAPADYAAARTRR